MAPAAGESLAPEATSMAPEAIESLAPEATSMAPHFGEAIESLAPEAIGVRLSDVPVTKKEGSGRHLAAQAAQTILPQAVAEDAHAADSKDVQPIAPEAETTAIDTASIEPVTRDSNGAPDMNFDDEEADSGFFSKPVDVVHHEEAVREAPELHDPEFAPAPVYRRKGVDRRARSIVMSVLGVCALIGATAMVRRATVTPTTQTHLAAEAHDRSVDNATVAPPLAPPAIAEVTTPPVAEPAMNGAAPVDTAQPSVADPSTAQANAALPTTPPPAATVADPAMLPTAAAPTAATTTTAATVAAAETNAAPTAAVANTANTANAAGATTAAATTVATTAAPPAADDADALSGPQLLAAARSAINSNPSKAATLARKAASKGAGGSAYYVLGAAYQMMGATKAAKNAYASCAKSGAAEASECTALVENL